MSGDPDTGSSENAVHRPSGDKPALPYARAFVVQFSAETDARLERATGRVEHLQTGRRAAFASSVELLQRIGALLGDDSAEPAKPSGPMARGSAGRGSKSARGGRAESASP